jgi:hypothetical protein
MNDQTKGLVQDIRSINAFAYVPSAIKLQMIVLIVERMDADAARDWRRAQQAVEALNALQLEWLPATATGTDAPAPITEESALYAAALSAAQETESNN